ncbi:MAG TPA: LLM class F420-dependent oxidoreductase [Acidimicrobiia bacterium]|nr:LLM class F420-dependent oxidoreductase [Acidimicrobiia bacterium]
MPEQNLRRPIRVAAQLHPQHGEYPRLHATVDQAEEMGFDLLYTWDHFYPLYGERNGAHFECWTMLAAWAEQTTTIELGALVTCNSYRNPDLLADMARTVDHISGGRLVFGIGAGWFRRDFEEYGYEFGTAGSRLESLAGAIPRIKTRWEKLNPPPVRRPPILIGGGGLRKTLRMVAEHADSWHAGFPDDPAELEPKVSALLGWCDQLGRDPAEIEWGLGVEPEDLDRFLSDDVASYVEMGFTQFTLGFQGPDWDLGPGGDWLAWRDRENLR